MNDELRRGNEEDRLRELLRDPGWSLEPRPGAQLRVRQAARRQRRAAACAAGGTALVIAATAFAFPALLRSAPARHSAGLSATSTRASQPGAARPSAPRGTATPTGQPSTPALGSAAFPASIYPAPKRPRMDMGALALCPDPAGLENPGPYTAAAARTVLHQLGRRLASDLKVSDRSAWPFLTSSWRTAGLALPSLARMPVRFAGPLQSVPGVPAGLRRSVLAGCGTRVAHSTWVISFRLARRPALKADMLFVTRRGHMLLYGVI